MSCCEEHAGSHSHASSGGCCSMGHSDPHHSGCDCGGHGHHGGHSAAWCACGAPGGSCGCSWGRGTRHWQGACACHCGCHCCCGGASCECLTEGAAAFGFRRRFVTREERRKRLEAYLAELKAEAQAVEEQLSELAG